MQRYRMAPCDLSKAYEIGSGGNGKVVLVPKSSLPVKVVKYFSVDDSLGIEKRNRRYKRFCREINVQKKLGKLIKGVLPVYDYSFPGKFSQKQPAWFMMPKANRFNVFSRSSTVYKLRDMLELAHIIYEIHKRNMAHRDIKPENILIWNEQICLTDFGLVWMDGEESLTQITERLGPIKIMPPELDVSEEIRTCDYKKSDVYLFAKVLWMYLKCDKYGFRGPYDRVSKQIYLLSSDFEKYTLEPLHKLLQEATKDNWEDRPNIDTCMEYIHHQIMILEGRLPKDLLEVYMLDERLNHFEASVEPNYKVYNENVNVKSFLGEMIPGVKIDFDNGMITQTIKPMKVRELSSNMFVFSHLQIDESICRIAVHINSIEKYDDKIIIVTERLTEEEKRYIIDNNLESIDIKTKGIICLK